MTRKTRPTEGPVPLSELGLPQHSALTIEGRIERAAQVGTHATRVRDGRERPLRSSSWSDGLLLVAAVFGLFIAAMVVLYLVG